jgi:CheY-like chemotaxis protein/HPt (histidine-containing phosphotransfer) domain-containing protein
MAILDMQIQGRDGLSLAKQIRSLPGCQKLPLVMLTGIDKKETANQIEQLELAAFINKPIKQSQIYKAFNSILTGQPIKVQRRYCPIPQHEPDVSSRLPLRILLAEDNCVNQQVAQYLLQQIGYRADIAGNGLEVLDALRRQPYDVVLMDVQMPGMDGLEATKRICQEWLGTSRPRIIAMTANAMQGDKEECLKAGMDDYISKPIRLEKLVEALSKCQPQVGDGAQESKLVGAGKTDNLSLQQTALQQNPPSSPTHRVTTAPNPVLDAKILRSFCNAVGKTNSAMVANLIDCYLEEAPKLLQSMSTGVVRKEAIALRIAAHTLKSSSAAIGATNLANICKDLEAMSRAGRIEGASEIVLHLEAEYEKVKAALQEYQS